MIAGIAQNNTCQGFSKCSKFYTISDFFSSMQNFKLSTTEYIGNNKSKILMQIIWKI